MKFTKKNIKKVMQVLNFLLGLGIMTYFVFRLKNQQYVIGDSVVEYGVSMHYDFKIISVSEDAFYNFDGITREGKNVKFKIPKIWNLNGMYSLGDSICKEPGDSILHLVKPQRRLDIPIEEKESISFFFH